MLALSLVNNFFRSVSFSLLGNVVEGVGVSHDGRDGHSKLGTDIGSVLAVGGCEDEALVGVVANHDLNALVELSTCQELSRQGRQEITVDDRSVGEAAVGGQADGDRVGELQSLGRELARLLNARHVRPLEEVLEDLLLLVVGCDGCEARRLRDCLGGKSI